MGLKFWLEIIHVYDPRDQRANNIET